MLTHGHRYLRIAVGKSSKIKFELMVEKGSVNPKLSRMKGMLTMVIVSSRALKMQMQLSVCTKLCQIVSEQYIKSNQNAFANEGGMDLMSPYP